MRLDMDFEKCISDLYDRGNELKTTIVRIETKLDNLLLIVPTAITRHTEQCLFYTELDKQKRIDVLKSMLEKEENNDNISIKMSSNAVRKLVKIIGALLGGAILTLAGHYLPNIF
jgi:RNA binding exosome subunit